MHHTSQREPSLAESIRDYADKTRNLPLAHLATAAAHGDLDAMGKIRSALESIDTSVDDPTTKIARSRSRVLRLIRRAAGRIR